jgi:hypothetical protein
MNIRSWLKKNKIFFETITASLLSVAAIVVSILQFHSSSKQTELMDLQIRTARQEFQNSSAFEANQFLMNKKQNALMLEQTKISNLLSSKSIEFTKQQIDISKTTTLKVYLTGKESDQLCLKNTGENEIKDLQMTRLVDLHIGFDGAMTVFTAKQKIVDILPKEKDFILPFSQLPISKIPRPKKGEDAFAITFQYRRAPDMKLFYKIVCFSRGYLTDGKIIYFPLYNEQRSLFDEQNKRDQQMYKELQSISKSFLDWPRDIE